ncbi:Swi5 domain-containing protein [Phanerochaete sordida]|uniref:Swi5 domain-containing protein n=1 Tax=Phanerochaete sordida TaxID=48140 RepID=A0A9P3LBX2_9APHY|nr:Swi5 domain-containing protein [Phanerochaete sordida]
MHATMSTKKQQERIAALEQEIIELQAKLGTDEDADEMVSKHIKLLHSYNEAKDAAQILVGRLAAHRGVTIRQIYHEYGLTDKD